MRKRKFHIIDWDGSSWSVCGVQCQVTQAGGRPAIIHNGLFMDKVKSPCKITCKHCRKSWAFHQIQQKTKAIKAHAAGA